MSNSRGESSSLVSPRPLTATPATVDRPLCRYFASNICYKGDTCNFSHQKNARPDMTCRYYLAGNCTYGSGCRYDHVKPDSIRKNNAGSETPTTSKKSSSPATGSGTKLVTAPPPKTNAWQTEPSALDNFHEFGSNLELIDGGYAGAVRSQLSRSISEPEFILPADVPLCPYFEQLGECMNGDICQFVHGQPCEMCHTNALHPFNEDSRKHHHRECLAEHERAMEASFAEARSLNKQCGICMEVIVEKGLRFGILANCMHCFCLECIRKWRKRSEEFDAKTVRSCPECRVHSDFIIPSSTWIEDREEKMNVIKMYQGNMKQVQCKYLSKGKVDDCPFGNKCFYKHQLPGGEIVEGDSPTTLRKKRRFFIQLHHQSFFDFSDSDDDSDTDGEDGDFITQMLAAYRRSRNT